MGLRTRQAEQKDEGSNPIPPRSESSTIVCEQIKLVLANEKI